MATIKTPTSPYRSWPTPANGATWLQDWKDTIFLHWPVDPEVVDKLTPDGVKPDVIDGKAWISIVAFSMENVLHKYLPVPASWSEFDEINVRTYVTDGRHRGVYFLSIQASKKFASWLSRKASGMPYRFTSMMREEGEFRSWAYPERFDCRYQIGEETEKDELTVWLTERYGLFRMNNNKLMWQEINHEAWPTRQLKIEHISVNYPQFGLDGKVGPALCHYSPGVTACIWNPRRAEPALAHQNSGHRDELELSTA